MRNPDKTVSPGNKTPRISPEKSKHEERRQSVSERHRLERKNSQETLASSAIDPEERVFPSVALSERQQRKWDKKKGGLSPRHLTQDQIGYQKQILANLGVQPLILPSKHKKTKSSSSIPQSPQLTPTPHHGARETAPTSISRRLPDMSRLPSEAPSPRLPRYPGLAQMQKSASGVQLERLNQKLDIQRAKVDALNRLFEAERGALKMLQQKRDKVLADSILGQHSERQLGAQDTEAEGSNASSDISEIVKSLQRQDRHHKQ